MKFLIDTQQDTLRTRMETSGLILGSCSRLSQVTATGADNMLLTTEHIADFGRKVQAVAKETGKPQSRLPVCYVPRHCRGWDENAGIIPSAETVDT